MKLYIGNFIFNEYAQNKDSLFDFKNNFNRDIDAFKKYVPNYDWSNVKQNILK